MATISKDDYYYTLTSPVVMLHPNLQTPKKVKVKGKETGEPKFSGMFVFPKDHADVKPIVNKMGELILAEWPSLTTEEVNNIIKAAIQSGAKEAKRLRDEKKGETVAVFVEDKLLVKSSSQFDVTLGSWNGKEMVDHKTPEEIALNIKKFYSGVFTGVKFKFVPMEIDGKKMVVKYLIEVVSLNRGEKIGDSRSAASTFSSYVGKHTAENPKAGADNDSLDDILG